MKAIINAARRQPVTFQLDGRALEITMSLDAIAEIQDKFGDLGTALEKTSEAGGIRTLISLLAILLNDAVTDHNDAHPGDRWEPYTERQIARRFDLNDIPELRRLLTAVISAGLPDSTVAGADVPDEMRAILDSEAVPEDADAKN
jgi:hypothetical protein